MRRPLLLAALVLVAGCVLPTDPEANDHRPCVQVAGPEDPAPGARCRWWW